MVDAKSGELQHRLDGPYRFGRSGLKFSQDGQLLARIGTDKIVPIWSTKTGQRVVELHTESHEGDFSADGRWFAVGLTDEEKGLAVWKLRDEAEPAGPRPDASADEANEAVNNKLKPLQPESKKTAATLPPPKRDDVRGLDLSQVKVRGWEEAHRATPDLYVADPESEWKFAKNVFLMPLSEYTWLYYPAGSGHFYILHRHEGVPANEQLYGPIAGDPFDVLKLEDLLREQLKPDAKKGDPSYRLRLMFANGEPSIVRRAWRMIEPMIAPKFDDNTQVFYERLELFGGVRAALLDHAEAFRKPELKDVATAARQRVEAVEAELDAINDAVADESYQSATYLQPKLAVKIPDSLWGKPLDGLRLALVPHDPANEFKWGELGPGVPPTSVTVQAGSELNYQLLVENVSDHEIKLCGFPGGEERSRTPIIRDSAGKLVHFQHLHTTTLSWHSYWRLKPGERYLLSLPAFHIVRPDAETRNGRGYSVQTAPGEYTLQCSYNFGRHDNNRHRHVPGKTEWIGRLTTGSQQIVVVDSAP